MNTFSVAEAKNNLSRLIDLALSGEKVTITRHGAPVAELRPAQKAPRPMSAETLALLRAARARIGVAQTDESGASVSRLRDEEWDGR